MVKFAKHSNYLFVNSETVSIIHFVLMPFHSSKSPYSTPQPPSKEMLKKNKERGSKTIYSPLLSENRLDQLMILATKEKTNK